MTKCESQIDYLPLQRWDVGYKIQTILRRCSVNNGRETWTNAFASFIIVRLCLEMNHSNR